MTWLTMRAALFICATVAATGLPVSAEEPLAPPADTQPTISADGAPASPNPLYRNPAHLHYAQGLGLMASGDLLGAMAELREALRIQPDMAQARFSLGTVLYLSGDVDSAIDAYRAALHIQPDVDHMHLDLANALMVKQDWIGAQTELQTVLTLNPESAPAHYRLGLVRYRLGDRRGAIESFRQAVQLKPDYADVHYHLGLVLKLINQEADATKEFLTAAEAGVPEAQYFAGVALASGLGVARHLPTAIGWWFRAAEQDVPEAKEALTHLRQLAQATGKRSADEAPIVQQAFADFRSTIWKQFPDLAGASPDYSAGAALVQQNRLKEALPVLIREASALSEPAQNQLETLYLQGIDVQLAPHNPKILAYFKDAAEEGQPYPRVVLARLYAQGLGLPKDQAKAAGLLKGLAREDAQALLKELPPAPHENHKQRTPSRTP